MIYVSGFLWGRPESLRFRGHVGHLAAHGLEHVLETRGKKVLTSYERLIEWLHVTRDREPLYGLVGRGG